MFSIIKFVPCMCDYYRCESTQIGSDCYGILLDEYYIEDSTSTFANIEFIETITAFGVGGVDEPCLSFFKVIVCLLDFPPCNGNTSELLPICLDRCPEIQTAYQHCYQGDNREIFTFEFVDPSLRNAIENFNCSNPQTYNFNSVSISNICSKLSYFCPLY